MLALMTPVPTDAPAVVGLLSATAVSGMSDGELHEFYLERRRRERVAAAEGAVALAEIERRRSFLREGYLSAAAFVAHRSGDSHRAAAGLVRVARSLREMPRAFAAFQGGEIGAVRVRRLIDAWEAAPHRFTDAE